MLAGYLFLRFKDGREICQKNPLQTLMNLQHLLYFLQNTGCARTPGTDIGSSYLTRWPGV